MQPLSEQPDAPAPPPETSVAHRTSAWVALRNGTRREFFHRNTPGDLETISQVFVREQYSVSHLPYAARLQSFHDDLLRQGRRPLILDAGAHIGASAVYWWLRFPRAHVTAWEPAPDNFRLLLANTAGIDADLRQAAIGSRAGTGRLLDPGRGENAYRVEHDVAAGSITVESAAAAVEQKLRGGYVPFIAKVDIEGGESDLFSRDTAWVDAFPVLMIELHDWMLPGAGSSRSFLRCVAQRDRDFLHRGETVFSVRTG